MKSEGVSTSFGQLNGGLLTNSANEFTSLLLLYLDHGMSHLGSYNWEITCNGLHGSMYKQDNCDSPSESRHLN